MFSYFACCCFVLLNVFTCLILLPKSGYSSSSTNNEPPISTQITIKKIIPIDNGLNILWKSNPNNGMMNFKVIVKLLEKSSENIEMGNEPLSMMTNNTELQVRNLFPGALYTVQVMYDNKKETHSVLEEIEQVVKPLPPSNVTARYVNESSISLSWDSPHQSFVSGYHIEYKAENTGKWNKVSFINQTKQELTNLLPGEKYTIEVSSVSHSVLCTTPVQIIWYTPPTPVEHVVALPSAESVTLKFHQPEGRFDSYIIRCKSSQFSERKFAASGDSRDFVTFLIDHLTPRVKYEFTIASVSYNVESKARVVYSFTWPQLDYDLIVVQPISFGTSLVISYTPPHLIEFDMFRFQISYEDELDHSPPKIIEKLVNDSITSLTFDSLSPGDLYRITVWTVSDEITSVPTQRLYRLRPNSVANVICPHVSNTSITLSWQVQGKVSAFEIVYNQVTLRTPNTSITIPELRPSRKYTFSLSVISGTDNSLPARSLPVNVTVETLESVPGVVSYFHPVDIQPRNITFTWFLPDDDTNGVITKFTLSYMIEGNISALTSIDFKSEASRGTITGLIPNVSYTFKLKAQTKVGYGPETTLQVNTPSLPTVPESPTIDQKTSRTIRVKLHKNYFPEDYGPIISYTLIVAENYFNFDKIENSTSLNMLSWRKVQSFIPWVPYQALEPREFFVNSSVEYYTIGSDECLPDVSYCNGPLKSGTSYRVKLRAVIHLEPYRYSDTRYSSPITTNKDFTVPVIIGLVIISFLSPILIILFRRNVSKKKDPDTPLKIFRQPIPVASFKTKHIDVQKLLRQFEELKPVGKGQLTLAAELAINRPKNRFSDILPYDNSRYKLQPVDDEEGSDYVNASYIPGYFSPRHYIATQGPLACTQNDFWRMCWESRTPAIVMLTQCEEKGRTKCYRYWPLGESPLQCGDIEVQLIQKDHYADWSVTQLRLIHKGEHRTVTHFHFTSWPDFGVPQPPDTLVRFLDVFRTQISPAQHPIVVHCSAGVGRTGTFIALDSVVQGLHSSERVDILGVVHRMRKARMGMVQTSEQYHYIYQCVKIFLQGVDNVPERQIHPKPDFEYDEGVEDIN